MYFTTQLGDFGAYKYFCLNIDLKKLGVANWVKIRLFDSIWHELNEYEFEKN